MPALTWVANRRDDGRTQLLLRGKLDESFDPAALLSSAGPGPLVLHMGGVRHVTSVGIREFERFLDQVRAGRGVVTLVEVSAAIASHIVLLPSLSAVVDVESALLPYSCSGCGDERLVVVPFVTGGAAASTPTCERCGRRMFLDGLAEQYLPS